MSSTSENEQLGVRAKTPSSLVGMFDVCLLFAKMAKKRSYEVTAPISRSRAAILSEMMDSDDDDLAALDPIADHIATLAK